jgi:hypothetical protein
MDLAATIMSFIFVVSMLANRLLKREAVEY